MRLRPLNDVLVVELDSDEFVGISKPDLIHLPEAYEGAYKKRSKSGRIVSWGSRCRYSYKEGEKVYFSWYDNRPSFTEEGKDYRLVSELELLAKDEDA